MMFLVLRILGVKNKKKGLKTDMKWLEICITVVSEHLHKKSCIETLDGDGWPLKNKGPLSAVMIVSTVVWVVFVNCFCYHVKCRFCVFCSH